MSKELDQLVAYIEENADGYFLKGTHDLGGLLNKLFSNPDTLNSESQRVFFLLSMRCYPLFEYTLKNRDLKTIPELLRYSLLSKCFYSDGRVVTPMTFAKEVDALISDSDQDWYENQVVDYRIFNLRYKILENSTLDLEILEDQFENSGDVTDIRAILDNPNCPSEFLEQIVDSDHHVFEERENLELIEIAKKILASRKSNTE